MKKYILVVLGIFLVCISCAYVKMVRHLKINVDKEVVVNKKGTLNEVFVISPTTLVNSLDENIKSKSAVISNVQIETAYLVLTLNPDNTSSRINNLNVTINDGTQTKKLLSRDTFLYVNRITARLLNGFLELEGASQLKKAVEKNLDQVNQNKKNLTFNLTGSILPGETFSATIKIVLNMSFDAETCEEVTYGFGPSECMIVPVTLKKLPL